MKLTITNVSKTYSNGVQALKNINLSIPAGMFALSSLLFRSRLKEVSIRKVFGADQWEIIRQFYSRYAIFTLVAIVAGIPIAIYLGNLWLQTFEYRIDLASSFFVKAGACVLMVGLLSVSYYLMQVAFSNPVKFLRNE